MKKKIELTKEQAEEMYYNINSYFLALRMAEMIDKTMFSRLKFGTPLMNNHLRKARESIQALLGEFNKVFRAKDTDIVEYEAPAALFEVLEYFSRMPPEQIEENLKNIKNYELPTKS
jgi:nitrate reductase assembly molybdenum cofactor insertion protein NarJ